MNKNNPTENISNIGVLNNGIIGETHRENVQNDISNKINEVINQNNSYKNILIDFIDSPTIEGESEIWEEYWKERIKNKISPNYNGNKSYTESFFYRDVMRKLESPTSEKVTEILSNMVLYELTIFDKLKDGDKQKLLTIAIECLVCNYIKDTKLKDIISSFKISDIKKIIFTNSKKPKDKIFNSFAKYCIDFGVSKDNKDEEIIEKTKQEIITIIKNIDFFGDIGENDSKIKSLGYDIFNKIILEIIKQDPNFYDDFFKKLDLIERIGKYNNKYSNIKYLFEKSENFANLYQEYKKRIKEEGMAKREILKNEDNEKICIDINLLKNFKIIKNISFEYLLNPYTQWNIIDLNGNLTNIDILKNIYNKLKYSYSDNEKKEELNKVKKTIIKKIEESSGDFVFPSKEEIENNLKNIFIDIDITNINNLQENLEKIILLEENININYNILSQTNSYLIDFLKEFILKEKIQVVKKIEELEEIEFVEQEKNEINELQNKYLTQLVESKIDYLIKLYQIKSKKNFENIKGRMSDDNGTYIGSVGMGMSQSLQQEIKLIQRIQLLPDIDFIEIEMGDENEKIMARLAMIDWVIPHEIGHLIDGVDGEKKLSKFNQEENLLFKKNIVDIIKDKEIIDYIEHDCKECFIDGIGYMMAKEYGTSNTKSISQEERIIDVVEGFESFLNVVDYIIKTQNNTKSLLSFLIRINVICENIGSDIEKYNLNISISKIQTNILQYISQINTNESKILSNKEIESIKQVMGEMYKKGLNWND